MNTNTDFAAIYSAEIDNDVDLLEKNVQDYPASSLAHFLLLYHLKKNGDSRFDEFAKRTAVYLHDPFWIEYQLSKLSFEKENVSIESDPKKMK